MRRNRRFDGVLASILTSILLSLALGACASTPTPPSKQVTSLDQVAGTWDGTVTGPGGTSSIKNLIVRPDGTWQLDLIGGTPPRHTGAVRLVDGKLRSKSDTTGNSSTWTLYEGDGKRILKSVNDDGRVSAEFSPARP